MLERNALGIVREIIEDYNKMAFVSGPRQVGKTTLAKRYRELFGQSLYLNWDTPAHQKKILTDPLFFEKENRDPGKPFLVVLDEIHKYARWKNYLKGIYDQSKDEFRFLITGSGRLELFKKGGDSLLGRYFSVPLFPFSAGELQGKLPGVEDFKRALGSPPAVSSVGKERYSHLFRFSGFPEPFSRGTSTFYNRWFSERKTLLLREDIRDASAIREISLLEHLAQLIPDRVGSPLSLNSLKEDVGVAFETIRDWLLLLEQFFYLFRLAPFTGRLARTLRKENKVYLFDWVEIENESLRFENLIALHLLKAVRLWKAMGEGEPDLHYIRDKEKREVDFVLSEKGKPICLIECKATEETLAPGLLHFQKKLSVPTAVQILHKSGVCKKMHMEGLTQWVISADQWLSILP
ncbi:MAG: ATP-binding protein [Deltaproteobacteria bacterium]|nr:MAG: ATP-binding protein [Deltaproteobacteria bacterium]